MAVDRAANSPYKLPPPLFSARCKACWFALAVLALVVASFVSLDMQWGAFLSRDAMSSMGRFVGEFFPPDVSPPFLRKLLAASIETLAMSALGTLIAALFGLFLALPASRKPGGQRALLRSPTRWLLNVLRSIPELVWAALLLISAGRTIQARTESQMKRAAQAMTDMLDAIREAEAAGASAEQLAPIFDLQKKAMWRLDFVSSENSKGFHADQEAMRILGESIDYSRQAQAAALRLRAPDAPPNSRPVTPVEGITQ
jgi:hypothetical protein